MNQEIEFRYYEMPAGHYVLPKMGEGWRIVYGIGDITHLHFHNYMEIGYCREGYGKFAIRDKIMDYRAGMLSVISANIPHTTENPDGNESKWDYLFINMDDFVKNELGAEKLRNKDILQTLSKLSFLTDEKDDPDTAALLNLMFHECEQKKGLMDEALNGYLRALVIRLMRIAKDNEEELRSTRMNSYISVATDYIEEHYAENLKVADIAKECGLSESHFRRTFEKCTNIKPLDYLNMVRVDKACELLYKKKLSMDEVGKKVGFETASSFNRNFRKLTGKSPLQWKHSSDEKGGDIKNYHINIMKGWDF